MTTLKSPRAAGDGLSRAYAIGKYSISRYRLCVLALLLLGGFARIYGIGSMVSGINQDEASIGYDAWAIAHYGMDRNLTPLPAHLIAWGSGQNAGYAWLLVPFIKLFGLNLFTLRLPMALVGCVSLWAMYTVLRRSADRRLALLGLFLTAVCPWHIQKSRWALESNLFPDMLLWGAALLCAGIASYDRSKSATTCRSESATAGGTRGYWIWYYAACLIWGLSAWCYATSFIMLPLFILPTAAVLLRKKLLPPLHILGCAGVFLLACGPIVAFSVINMFELSPLRLPFLTIPRLVFMRKGEFAFFGDDPLGQLRTNAREILSILINQDDGWPWSATRGSGLIYMFSLPLALAGIIRAALPRNRDEDCAPMPTDTEWTTAATIGTRWAVPGGWVFAIWGAAALLLSVSIFPNVNRANGLWFPLVWFWILGAWELARQSGFWRRFITGLYAACFLMFCGATVNTQTALLNDTFDAGFLEAVRYVDGMDRPVYVSGAYVPYIKVLFATTPSPMDFRASITDEDRGSGDIYQWGKWTAADPPDAGAPAEDYAIVVRDGREQDYLDAGWRLVRFDRFWAGYYEK